MENIGFLVGLYYLITGTIVVILLLYFLSKRLKDKKKERFEKRDN